MSTPDRKAAAKRAAAKQVPAKKAPAKKAPAKKAPAKKVPARKSASAPRETVSGTAKIVLPPLSPPAVARKGCGVDERTALLHGLSAMDLRHPSAPRRQLDLLHAYVEGLPWLAVSRCPLTEQEMIYPIDTVGFDGPWWDYEHPARPDENLLPTVHAVTGAVAVSTPPATDWIVRPGPGVPFVAPHVLERKGVVAVLSEVMIGKDRGFLTVYYAKTHPTGPRFNTWGREGYRIRHDGELVDLWEPELVESIDTDLGPWIDAGKLSWIAPGDRKLVLQSKTAKCPFLSVKGRPEFASIRYGKKF